MAWDSKSIGICIPIDVRCAAKSCDIDKIDRSALGSN